MESLLYKNNLPMIKRNRTLEQNIQPLEIYNKMNVFRCLINNSLTETSCNGIKMICLCFYIGRVDKLFIFVFQQTKGKLKRCTKTHHILNQDSILNKKYILKQNTVVRNVSFDLVHVFVLIVKTFRKIKSVNKAFLF